MCPDYARPVLVWFARRWARPTRSRDGGPVQPGGDGRHLQPAPQPAATRTSKSVARVPAGVPDEPAEDATLADFLEASDAGDGEKAQGTNREDDDAAPAASTYEWAPAGAECAACGAVVQRRWRQADELVCEACKEWSAPRDG